MGKSVEVVVMGGSWGGMQASLAILKDLPANFSIPIILILHRLRNYDGNLQQIYRNHLVLDALEVEEKEMVKGGYVYLAPANYHVLIEKDKTFSLDVSELVNYSRPSIDVTFMSVADAFEGNVAGILLSGANKDGSAGLKYIVEAGGVAIVQSPAEAEVDIMPNAAISLIPDCTVLSLEQIKDFLLSLT
jgi:two-component system, chemotaxis family, protein-glutamate methylesterase/glutaminase